MKQLLTAYTVLASVVGTSIITLLFIGVPLKYVHEIWPSVLPVGTHGWKIGSDINLYLGTAHGFIYMVFVLVAFMLSLRLRWPIVFTVITLACGTIPFLSFWAEHRAIIRAQADIAAAEATAAV